MWRVIGWIAGLGALAGAYGAVWVRVAPEPADAWHVEPLEAPSTGGRSSWRVGPEGFGPQPLDATTPAYLASPSDLAVTFDARAMSRPRVRRLATSRDGLHVTYVQRSRVMGFPDYVSVRFIDLGDGAAGVAAFSRARYGREDFGVNRDRLRNWLAALEPFAR